MAPINKPKNKLTQKIMISPSPSSGALTITQMRNKSAEAIVVVTAAATDVFKVISFL
jgi:hypothetical protein